MASSAIVIPARFGSTRFPGKPLADLRGRTMLSWVVEVAKRATTGCSCPIYVASEDQRILEESERLGVRGILTSNDCLTGSDRVLQAVRQLDSPPDIVINLQGDAPLTPPAYLRNLLARMEANPHIQVATTAVKLFWDELDALRSAKRVAPLSGTFVVVDRDGRALWFSKMEIPALRQEAALRQKGALSPVYRHLGIYGYRLAALEKFHALDEGVYERLEGLEQLRLLEQGIPIHVVCEKSENVPLWNGVDTPSDLAKVEALLGVALVT